jgi:ANTAR domain-containing protein
MKSNTADTGGPGRHARDRKPRTAAAPPGGGTSGQDVPGWHDAAAGRHAASAKDRHAQSTGTGRARADGPPVEHPPVARRTANGWRVGDEEVSDLTSAMVLADLLAADLPTQAMPTVGSQAQAAASFDGGQAPDPRRLEQTVAQLEHALTARVRVEQAIGVLAERHRLRPRQAFELLRSVARAQGRRVLEMATEVVDSATNPLLRIPEELAKPPVVRRRGRRLGPDAG